MPSSPSSPAENLVAPAFLHVPDFHQTLGPEVGQLCTDAGFGPDPEQQMLLDGSFGIDKRARLTAFEVALVAPRQNIKTGFLKQQALGKAFLLKRPLIVWSAHEFNTTKEAFRDLVTLIESAPELDRRVHKIMRGNGDEAIELHGGRTRIVFRARTKSGGRGLSGDDVDLDEALYLQPDHVGSLLPVLSTRKNPQVTYAGSAGIATSAVWRGIRDRGRRGLSPRLMYAEWTIERLDGDEVVLPPCAREDCTHEPTVSGCVLDDRELIGSVNTQAGRRISWEYLEDERQALPPAEYLRERGGVWDEPASSDDPPAIDSRAWERLANPKAAKQDRVQVVLHAAPDGSRYSLATAGDGSAGRVLVLVWTSTDARKVVKRLQRLLDRGRVAGKPALNPRTQAGALVTLLRKADIEFDEIGALERGQATVGMLRAVEDGTVEHTAQIELDLAVTEARTRRVDEGEVFDQRDPSGPDISPLIAAAGARHRWAIEGDYDIEDSFL